jgi:ring-1,2-phenylacetyl-CoA epoxidase subunit PaaD
MTDVLNHTVEAEEKKLLALFEQIMDPEVPVLSILDLGIVRSISLKPIEGKEPGASGPQYTGKIQITPTYSGCPAMDTIRTQIRLCLIEHGYSQVAIETVLSPAWTTDWMSKKGKEKLKAFGIAPPNPKQQVCDIRMFHEGEAIQCPRCNSYHTELISQFGSTACKAFYRCLDCQEPFDYFKCH